MYRLYYFEIKSEMESQVVNRKVAIAVDLSDESAYAVRWAVANYLRPSDTVILLHVQPTSILYGADWGSMEQSVDFGDNKQAQQQSFDDLTSSKASDLSKPILDAKIPLKIHIVKDHDMKERICLEVERLGVNAVIMGSRGFGAVKKSHKARLGSVSDYCVHHCDCPVVVVRFPDEEKQACGFQKLSENEEKGEKEKGEGKKKAEEIIDSSSNEISQEDKYENGSAKKIRADVEA